MCSFECTTVTIIILSLIIVITKHQATPIMASVSATDAVSVSFSSLGFVSGLAIRYHTADPKSPTCDGLLLCARRPAVIAGSYFAAASSRNTRESGWKQNAAAPASCILRWASPRSFPLEILRGLMAVRSESVTGPEQSEPGPECGRVGQLTRQPPPGDLVDCIDGRLC